VTEGSAAGALVDWDSAARIAKRVAGSSPPLTPVQRAQLVEDFSEVVPEAQRRVMEFTGLPASPERARAWVMTRSEWIDQNLRGFRRLIEPLAERVHVRQSSLFTPLRRQGLALQLGLLMGYLSKKVLGQYDLFLPPEDQGLVYFVGPNVVTVERRFGFPERDFRLWIALHEVDHQLQFGGVPWLRGHVAGLVDTYFDSIQLDPKQLITALRRAVEEIRSGEAEWKGIGILFLLMTPEQRKTFREMQAVMSLLEGHGNFVMDELAKDTVDQGGRMRRTLKERRASGAGIEKTFQRAIGFEAKVRQYDQGERFVAEVVESVGMDGFNRVWAGRDNLPTLDEVARPDRWVDRVGAS
jgi:coenzyme F420 biosynthesis associated uncharacterized protein